MTAKLLIKNIKRPPAPIFSIAKSFVPVVYVTDSGLKDAVCFHWNGEYRIFVELMDNIYERVRYSLAHELAHFIFKHNDYLMLKAKELGIKIKRQDFFLFWNEVKGLEKYVKETDEEAETFAAEVLMPMRWLYIPKSAREFEELRKSLEVSKRALKKRLFETGMMTYEEIDRLFLKK
ncbi:MAG: ImmA/IrrE family metallo-endopeptidase [Clostridia bacterium]|nr:ImmA/IrrE family metallo-endopeptidase [Clostridia bacterium]